MLKIYSNGLTIGKPPTNSNHQRAKRTATTGWSKTATRANTAFLYSIDAPMLNGQGFAFTLTLRDLPPTPKDFAKIRDKFFKRMSRLGLLRYHWVMEWQRRGVPHLHGCLYFPDSIHRMIMADINRAWCDCVGKYHALQRGQDVKPIESSVGWLKYLAKHGSRSANHYQRTSKPKEWNSSGRVWGKGGKWPTRLTEHNEGDNFHRFRRIIKNWRVSNARDAKNAKRITQARRCLKNNERGLSAVRGMSEWIPEQMSFRIVRYFEEM